MPLSGIPLNIPFVTFIFRKYQGCSSGVGSWDAWGACDPLYLLALFKANNLQQVVKTPWWYLGHHHWHKVTRPFEKSCLCFWILKAFLTIRWPAQCDMSAEQDGKAGCSTDCILIGSAFNVLRKIIAWHGRFVYMLTWSRSFMHI